MCDPKVSMICSSTEACRPDTLRAIIGINLPPRKVLDFQAGKKGRTNITAVRQIRSVRLGTPIRGEVTELLPDSEAKVNIGRKDGLRAGMELVSIDEHLLSRMEIVSLDEGDAVVRKQFPDDAYRKIRVGDTLSTRLPPSRMRFQNNR